MVLESIVSPLGAQKHPQNSFILGFLYASIAVILAFFIFPSDPSLSAVFMTTLAALPFLINILSKEEEDEMGILKTQNRLPLIKTHFDVFLVFAFMFLGFLLCFLLIYLIFPQDFSNLLFKEQIKTIESIVGAPLMTTTTAAVTGVGTQLDKILSGNAILASSNALTAKAAGSAIPAEYSLKIIMINNFKVLLFSLLFSFLYGAGAIFILTWNSSILAVTMGNLIKIEVSKLGQLVGVSLFGAYAQASAVAVLRYFIHGIPEISGYFLGAVAGGIISAAVVRNDYRDPKFYEVLMDSIDLIALASLLLIVGALIEVTITPMLFSGG